MLQVIDVHELFEEINRLKKSQWKEVETVDVRKIPNPNHPSKFQRKPPLIGSSCTVRRKRRTKPSSVSQNSVIFVDIKSKHSPDVTNSFSNNSNRIEVKVSLEKNISNQGQYPENELVKQNEDCHKNKSNVKKISRIRQEMVQKRQKAKEEESKSFLYLEKEEINANEVLENTKLSLFQFEEKSINVDRCTRKNLTSLLSVGSENLEINNKSLSKNLENTKEISPVHEREMLNVLNKVDTVQKTRLLKFRETLEFVHSHKALCRLSFYLYISGIISFFVILSKLNHCKDCIF